MSSDRSTTAPEIDDLLRQFEQVAAEGSNRRANRLREEVLAARRLLHAEFVARV